MAEYKIKVVTTGAKEAAGDFQKLGTSVEATEKQTAKLTAGKSRLVDAFKKLKHEVPLAGAVLDTFKNPIAAVTIAASAAASAVTEYIAAIHEASADEAVAERLGKMPKTFFENAAIAKAASEQFRAELKLLKEQAETTEQFLKRMGEQMKLAFPDNERAQAAAGVINLGNARRREQNAADAALAALPAAEAEALAAQNELEAASGNVGRQNGIAGKRLTALDAKLGSTVARADNGGLPVNPFVGGLVKALTFPDAEGNRPFFPGPSKLLAQADDISGEMGSVQREIDQRSATLIPFKSKAESAAARVARLRDAASRSTTAAGQFGQEERAAAAAADFGYTPPPGMGPGSLQFRRDEQYSNFAAGQQAADVKAIAKALGEAKDEILKFAAQVKSGLANQSQQGN